MRILHIAALFAITTVAAAAQQQNQLPMPAVDNVSVIPSSSPHGTPFTIQGDTLTGTGITVTSIMERLYGVPASVILGLTHTQAARRYDITARIEAPASYAATPGHLSPREYMLTILLTRHLGISTHTELRLLPAYALAVMTSGALLQPLDLPARPINTGIDSTSHSIEGHAITIASFANTLGMLLDRPVSDQTGLSGSFNLSLHWQSDSKSPTQPIAAALQSQLGLTLAPTEASVKTVLVDHAEPVAN